MPLKVYYLDDEPDLLEIFKETFSTQEIEIVTFSDPTLAKEAISAHPPDLLILDYRMPGINGDQLAAALDPKLPKILITGEINVQLQSKFSHVISKPFKTEDIEQILAQVLEEKQVA